MALVAENISVGYQRKQPLLKEVSFSLESGQVTGLYGESGCGKSTLGKVLANMLKPWSGSLTIDGQNFVQNIYQPVQLIYQHPEKALNPRWTMERSLQEGFIPDKDLLSKFGIRDEWLTRYPAEISGGEMQRFCIVRALGEKTKYLIADEMTTMLDAITQAKIWQETLAICKERNIGLLVISHEMALLRRLCNKIINMEELKKCSL